MTASPMAQIQSAVQPLRQALLEHPLYHDIREVQALRTFMEYHVFAVWDFMSLLKALQQRLCCVTVPWLPGSPSSESRFINEIVLGEESDEDGRGGYASHFDLYHRAMREFGADTSRIDGFLAHLRPGETVPAALVTADVPAPIRRFVGHTFDVIATGDLCRIASAFTFGREDLLPDVFSRIVDEISRQSDGGAGRVRILFAAAYRTGRRQSWADGHPARDVAVRRRRVPRRARRGGRRGCTPRADRPVGRDSRRRGDKVPAGCPFSGSENRPLGRKPRVRVRLQGIARIISTSRLISRRDCTRSSGVWPLDRGLAGSASIRTSRAGYNQDREPAARRRRLAGTKGTCIRRRPHCERQWAGRFR